jgi:hypothetical protein
MAQAVSQRPPTAKDCAQSHASSLGICGKQSGTETDRSASTLAMSCEHHSVNAPTNSYITDVI